MYEIILILFAFLIGLFTSATGTPIESLFRWAHLGTFVDIVVRYNAPLLALTIALFSIRFVRNWKIVVAIFFIMWAILLFAFH